jgi:hypothetical protein
MANMLTMSRGLHFEHPEGRAGTELGSPAGVHDRTDYRGKSRDG